MLEDSAALYTCNIDVIGLYIYPQFRKQLCELVLDIKERRSIVSKLQLLLFLGCYRHVM